MKRPNPRSNDRRGLRARDLKIGRGFSCLLGRTPGGRLAEEGVVNLTFRLGVLRLGKNVAFGNGRSS